MVIELFRRLAAIFFFILPEAKLELIYKVLGAAAVLCDILALNQCVGGSSHSKPIPSRKVEKCPMTIASTLFDT
jgi:hypothetical protein